MKGAATGEASVIRRDSELKLTDDAGRPGRRRSGGVVADSWEDLADGTGRWPDGAVGEQSHDADCISSSGQGDAGAAVLPGVARVGPTVGSPEGQAMRGDFGNNVRSTRMPGMALSMVMVTGASPFVEACGPSLYRNKSEHF